MYFKSDRIDVSNELFRPTSDAISFFFNDLICIQQICLAEKNACGLLVVARENRYKTF